MNSIETPIYSNNEREVVIIDQTFLPIEEKWVTIRTPSQMIEAIKSLRVRGAPLLGLAGVYGLALAALHSSTNSQFKQWKNALIASRPTAVNLSYMISRSFVSWERNYSSFQQLETSTYFFQYANLVAKEIQQECTDMAKRTLPFVKDNASILTHCNSGSLAVGSIGTAVGAIKYAFRHKSNIHALCTETRPLRQGSRLTAYEFDKYNIPYQLLCDTAVGYAMANKLVSLVMVGADRIAANYDTANKIGTLQIAILADHYKIPFLVVAPESSFDASSRNGSDITIEQRSEDEVKWIENIQNTPINCKALNPAFDITPHSLITAIVTNNRVIFCNNSD